MRKLLFIFISLIMLVACGSETEPVKKEDTQENRIEKNNQKETEEDNDIDEGELLEVGQVIKSKDLGASVELLAIKEVNEIIDLDPIKLKIDDIKIIRMFDIKNADTKSFLSQFTDKEELNYIQIMYSIENASEDNIDIYYPISYIVLNTGEQIDVMMNDFMLDPKNGGEFFGKVTKESGIAAIIDKSDVQEIEKIKLITGDVWEIDGNMLVDSIEVEYTLD